MTASPLTTRGQRLDSWKEIASFFGRDERTVKRWEKERGLPVHRVPGAKGRVYAYSDELTSWLEGNADGTDSSTNSVPMQVLGSEGPQANARQETKKPLESRLAVRNLSATRVAVILAPLLVVGALVAALSFGNRGLHFKALAGRHTPNAEAQDLYLKGRYYWERRTPEDLNKAVDYFTQAIVKDPSDADPYVGLADCYNLLREFDVMPSTEAYPRALAAAQRAVELDDTSAEAHNSMAFATFWWLWHGATAEREFKRALELDPGLVRAHHWYATYLMARRRYPEALDQIEQAQRLEPSSTAILADKGWLLWWAGRRNEGIALLKQLEASQPSLSSTHDYLGRFFWEQQDYPNALLEWRRLAELRHDQVGLAIANARETGFAAGGLNGLWANEYQVRKELFNKGFGSAYDLARSCAALGRKQEALQYLQTSFDRREVSLLPGDPDFPTLRDEPAFQQINAQIADLLSK
jgi:tetratricopeptide (TPR) repeat protein